MPLTLKPATGSGQMTLISVAGTTTNDTLTLPAKTGNIITSADTGTVTQTMLSTNVAGNGPGFLAHRNGSNQTGISSSTATKVQLNNVSTYPGYNNGSGFDTSTNRFTPPVNGYYHIVGSVSLGGTNLTYGVSLLYRNNALLVFGSYSSASAAFYGSLASTIVYLTTSDYIELFASGTTTSGTVTVFGSSVETYLSATLVRAA
jgi:hypothetical protein